MWWGLQTLTSVGYGDFPVETIVGKLLAAMTAVCGVLVMALPIPIVVDNFADYYQEQKKIEAQELKDEAKVLPIMLIAKLCILLSNYRRMHYIHYSPNLMVGRRKSSQIENCPPFAFPLFFSADQIFFIFIKACKKYPQKFVNSRQNSPNFGFSML